MWNPSTCACKCDMWYKPGQHLDYKKYVCKNKLIGRVIVECTNIINKTMMNNKKNIANDNTTTNIFIVFAYSLILSLLRVKNYLKKNMLIIEITQAIMK